MIYNYTLQCTSINSLFLSIVLLLKCGETYDFSLVSQIHLSMSGHVIKPYLNMLTFHLFSLCSFGLVWYRTRLLNLYFSCWHLKNSLVFLLITILLLFNFQPSIMIFISKIFENIHISMNYVKWNLKNQISGIKEIKRTG